MLLDIVFAVVMSSSMQVPDTASLPVLQQTHTVVDVDAGLTPALPTLQQCTTNIVRAATFDFSISAAGVVTDVVRVSSGNDDPAMASVGPCLVERLRQVTFSAKAPALVRAVLRFIPALKVGDLVVITPSVGADVRLAASVAPGIAEVVAPHVGTLVQCYRDALTTSPTVAGTIIIQHTVGVDGAVADDAVLPTQKLDSSQILHVPLQRCVREVLRHIHYATPASSAVTLPLAFVQPRAPTTSEMRWAVSQHMSALLKCHPTGTPTAPLTIAFTVDGKGAATGTVPPGNLEPACAVAAVENTPWPAPSAGTVQVSTRINAASGLSRAEIQRVVSPSFPQIKRCYDVALKTNSSLEGVVTLRYVIDADGVVIDVEAVAPKPNTFVQITEPRFVACIVDIVRAHRYPQPRGGGVVNVTYPFVFSSKPQSAQ